MLFLRLNHDSGKRLSSICFLCFTSVIVVKQTSYHSAPNQGKGTLKAFLAGEIRFETCQLRPRRLCNLFLYSLQDQNTQSLGDGEDSNLVSQACGIDSV